MFEHLDDHAPGRIGTGAQLAAVRNRARDLTRERRRSQLAVGSVTLTAAASVSGLAALSGAGPLHGATGQAGAGGSVSAAKAGGSGTGAGAKPALAHGATERANGTPGSKAPLAGKASNPNGGDCDYSPVAAAETPPQGYVVNHDPASKQSTLPFHRADGANAKIDLKITCSDIAPEERTSTSKVTYTPTTVAGRPGYLWHAGTTEAGVEWTAADGTSVYVQATGAAGVRLSDAELEAYAAALPLT